MLSFAALDIFERITTSVNERKLPDGSPNPDSKVKGYQVDCEYIEIYCNEVNDLLDERNKDLVVHYRGTDKPALIDNLSERNVASAGETILTLTLTLNLALTPTLTLTLTLIGFDR